jgi:hypothetical protein
MDGPTDARKELTSGIILALVAGGYLLANAGHALDSLANPGPGVFPLAVGLLLAILAGWQVARAGGRLMAVPRDPGVRLGVDARQGWGQSTKNERAPFCMVATLALYLIVLGRLGFLSSTFVLVIICSKLMGSRGWGRPIALAFGIVLASYVLFSIWLKVPLPTGYLF